eukprot:CAMPEP_0176216010 /NCGR_PEP_ID=MMETSP0121_2-20121125/16974_1 /TAXON_ID=160619 /ORGANISM="Kryptoperidinium foliaceum, Strain CCMP 1326" /LENGTH=429 /DNA_ID=CAMNT_0017555131 /DNA_START=88 /DNA_END=1374 /DNA_ORIENTATION=-
MRSRVGGIVGQKPGLDDAQTRLNKREIAEARARAQQPHYGTLRGFAQPPAAASLGLLLVAAAAGARGRLLGVGVHDGVHAHPGAVAQVARDELPEVAPPRETEHRHDLLKRPAPCLRQAQHREGHHQGGEGAEEKQRAARPHGPRDHRRRDEGAGDVRRAPIHARAEAHGLAADAQRHDLGDVQPCAEAPGYAEAEHVSDDHGDDYAAGARREVAAACVRRQGHGARDEQRRGHARHAEDEQRPAARAVHEAEAADGVADEEGDAGGHRGGEADGAHGFEERASKGDHGVDPRHDLEELHRAAEQHHVPEVGAPTDLAPCGVAGDPLLLELRPHRGELRRGRRAVAVAQAGEDPQGLVRPPDALEKPRRVPHKGQADGGGKAQGRLHPQRYAPADLHSVVVIVQHRRGQDRQTHVALVDSHHGPADTGG